MPKYLCIQRSPSSQAEDCHEPSPSSSPSPAQMEQMFAKFNAWKESFSANLTDLGGRLGGGAVVRSEGATDGPFVEAKEVVGGYMIVTADSLEAALEVVQQMPGIGPSASIEVREIVTP